MNKECRNCGAPLNSNKVCSKCGAVNFQDPVEYSDFTTKKLNTKLILIIGIVAVAVIVLLIVLSYHFHIGDKEPVEVPSSYDTTYQNKKYKCEHAKSCSNDNMCIYEYEDNNGEIKHEVVNCKDINSNGWYN